MRSTRNRIAHALMFEVLGLLLVTPLGMLALHKPVHEIGAVALFGSLLATGWNYFYNLIFDRAMLRLRGRPDKTPAIRVLHAVLFEGGLLAILVPFAAWWLDIGLLAALILDLGFAGFYLVYAFVFNWAWDRIFPYAPAGHEA
ncbi:MAG: PACE efflux transporter [Paracoccaceae bacterium]